MNSNEETEINGIGPVIKEEELELLKQQVAKMKKGDMLVLFGNIPSCLSSDTYEHFISCLNDDVDLVIDAEKDLLLKCLPYHSFIIKPNNIELAAMFDVEINTVDEVIYYAKKL